jgi:hypothetical protein
VRAAAGVVSVSQSCPAYSYTFQTASRWSTYAGPASSVSLRGWRALAPYAAARLLPGRPPLRGAGALPPPRRALRLQREQQHSLATSPARNGRVPRSCATSASRSSRLLPRPLRLALVALKSDERPPVLLWSVAVAV